MYFNIWKSPSNNQFYFTMYGDNNEKVGQSEGYAQKASALNTVNMIKREAGTAKVNDKA